MLGLVGQLPQEHPQKIFGNVTFLQIITINSNQIFAGKKNYFIFLNETYRLVLHTVPPKIVPPVIKTRVLYMA